jgi:acyl carrier protein
MPGEQTVNKEEVAHDVCQIIETTRPKLAGLIKPTTLLTEKLGVDSLAFIEAVIGIEERFAIDMGDLEELDAKRPISVADLIDVVVAKLEMVRQ